MGRRPCCSKEGLNRGAWSVTEDKILSDYIELHGEGKWRDLPEKAGLKRCGKSCRLRWLNYLRPDIRRGNISKEEDDLIVRLHKLLGNRWALIAGRLPGRTDNEIKNYWNTNLRKRVMKSSNRVEELRKLSPLPSAAAAADEDRVIRTKAFRCTKVVNIIPKSISSVVDDDPIVESPTTISSLLDLPEQDQYFSDFLADFDINELLNMSDELSSGDEAGLFNSPTTTTTTSNSSDDDALDRRCIITRQSAEFPVISGDDSLEMNGKDVIMSTASWRDIEAFQPSYEGFDLNDLSRFLDDISEGEGINNI